MRYILSLIFIILAGCGYQSTSPDNNSKYSIIKDFSDLEGTYTNKGVSGHENPKYNLYLSSLIWKNDKLPVKHQEINMVNVISKDDLLIVKAIINDCAVYKSIYTKHKDIKIDDGKIVLDSSFAIVSSIHVGPSYDKRVIGIDEKGNGKFMRKQFAAGLVYMIMPFALGFKDEVRFDKAVDNTTYKDCNNTANKSLSRSGADTAPPG